MHSSGKYEEAFNITEEIITAVDNTKQRLFSFTPNADVEENPKTFLDLLFGLSNEKLADNYTAEYNATGKLYVDHYTITFDDNADYRNTKLLTKKWGPNIFLQNICLHLLTVSLVTFAQNSYPWFA